MNLSDTSVIEAEVRGRVGLITLNRPQALNALSLEMVRHLHAVLLAWRADPFVVAVALRGNSHGRVLDILLFIQIDDAGTQIHVPDDNQHQNKR